MRTFLRFLGHYLDPRNTFLGILVSLTALSCGIYFFFKSLLRISLSDEIYWPAALAVTGFTLIKFIETRTRRHNTLCNLEVELNQAMDTISVLINTLNKMIQTQIPMLMPHDLPHISVDLMKGTGQIDIKDNLANLLCDIRRINQDWNNLIQYGKEHDTAIKDPNHPQHQAVRIFGTDALSMLRTHSASTFQLVQETLLLVRIHIQHGKPFFRFGQPFIWPCEMREEIEAEKKKVVAELHAGPCGRDER